MDKLKKITETILDLLKEYKSILIVSLIGLFCVELLNHPNNDLIDTLVWIWSHKRVLVVNYIIYVNIGVIFYLIINRLNWSNIIFGGSLIIIGICNYYKLLMKGENVVLWDVLNMQAAAGMMTELDFKIGWQVIVSVICLIALVYHQFKAARKQQKRSDRGKYLALTFVILTSITVGITFNNQALKSLKITNMDWNQDKNYRENGFILSFFMNLKNITVEKPEHYSKQAVDEAIERINNINIEKEVSLEKKPNIVAVMIESFADITVANEGLSFEEELTPNINKINENIIKGNLLVSIFGGGTANSEFEFLTGNSMAHLPIGSIAYDRYIEEKCNSVVGILKQQNYSTYAIHPYLRTFWNRDEVYPIFGFDQFYTEEDFSQDAKRKKGYISDEEVYNKIINDFENKEEGKPFFSFSVTMQNHTPYSDTSNGTIGVNGDEAMFKENVKKEASIHAKGVQDGDAMFGKLVEYFSNCNEPTMVVVFGDHHPFISSTINKDADHLDDVNKFKTPFAIWTNYDIEEKQNVLIDSSMLGAYMMHYAGFELPNYLKLNFEASKIISGYNNYFVLDKNENMYHLNDEMPNDIKQFILDHQLLQYDAMFGKNFSESRLW